MVKLGKWRQGATWAERFAQEPAASYVAVDGSSKAPELSSSALLLPLGVLCEDSNSPKKTPPREVCDHIKHAVEALNNKNDGWYDELLPNHTIVTAVRSAGCGVEGLTRSAWLELQASLPGFTAVIGPDCSSDVRAVAGREWRASDGGRAVVISPSSTAPTLSDESAYPNVARALANDTQGSAAIAALCVALGWDRVALIHDSTTWGAGGAAAFQAAFEAGGGEILPGGQISFTLEEFDSGAVHARELLEQIKDQEAKVIVMIVQPYIQRALLAWSFDHETLYGPGYGWVSFWPGEAAFHSPDGSVNTSALQGAEGLISLHPTFDTSRAVTKSMVDMWRQVSSSECDGIAFCNADGDPNTWPAYAANAVDAVLLYAHAMDELRRTVPLSMDNPDALYETMLQLPSFEGLTGHVNLDDAGDAQGRFTFINFQKCAAGGCGLRRKLVSIFSAAFDFKFVELGVVYDPLTGKMTGSLEGLVFSQGTTQVPITKFPPSPPPPSPPALPPPALPPPPAPPPLPPDDTWLIVLIVGLLLVLLLGLTTVAFCRRNERQKEKQFQEKEFQKMRRDQFQERRKGRSSNGGFKPLIYELKEETEFKLEESERRASSSGSTCVDSLAARDSLAGDIREVQSALADARDERIGRWPRDELIRDELIELCHEAIREGASAASAAVYDAVFNTIVGQKGYEVRMQEYIAAADALQQRLERDNIAQQDSEDVDRIVWPKCKQGTADLADLYMEAVSVKDRARDIMKGLCNDSADGWRLEPGPLKKMRCAAHLRANSPPLTVCLLCPAAVAPARRLCCSHPDRTGQRTSATLCASCSCARR